MADGGAARQPVPLFRSSSSHQVGQIEGLGRHHDLASAYRPAFAGAIGVHLDPEPVRIGEIERLADEMIGGSRVGAHPVEMGDEPAERRAVGQQDREVIETEPASAGGGAGAGELVQLDERRVVSRAEHDSGRRAREEPESQDRGVVRYRSVEVGDLEHDAAQPGLGWKPIAGGGRAVGERGHVSRAVRAERTQRRQDSPPRRR